MQLIFHNPSCTDCKFKLPRRRKVIPDVVTVALDLTVKNPQSSSSYQVQGGGACTLHHFIGFCMGAHRYHL